MKYIITGGAGFIGSHIVDTLVKQKKKTVVIDNLATGKYENIAHNRDKISFYELDITDLEKLRSLFENGDIVFHLAALPSVPRSIENPVKSNQVNVDGTLNVLMAAKEKKCKRVIFSSSSSVYGDTEKLPKTEDMIPNPLSPYALTKLTGEYYMNIFYKLYGLETISLRYFNVFGPRQDQNSQYSAVIPKFIKAVQQNNSPTIYGDGLQSRDFTYIENVVNANILASEAKLTKGDIMNIATNKEISLIQVLTLINKFMRKNIKPTFDKPRLGDVKRSLADIEKARKLISYVPKVYFEEGLSLTIEESG